MSGDPRIEQIIDREMIRDCLFRSKLPMPAEDEALSKQREFWTLIEAGETARRR